MEHQYSVRPHKLLSFRPNSTLLCPADWFIDLCESSNNEYNWWVVVNDSVTTKQFMP
jgi:hypothetical protein